MSHNPPLWGESLELASHEGSICYINQFLEWSRHLWLRITNPFHICLMCLVHIDMYPFASIVKTTTIRQLCPLSVTCKPLDRYYLKQDLTDSLFQSFITDPLWLGAGIPSHISQGHITYVCCTCKEKSSLKHTFNLRLLGGHTISLGAPRIGVYEYGACSISTEYPSKWKPFSNQLKSSFNAVLLR